MTRIPFKTKENDGKTEKVHVKIIYNDIVTHSHKRNTSDRSYTYVWKLGLLTSSEVTFFKTKNDPRGMNVLKSIASNQPNGVTQTAKNTKWLSWRRKFDDVSREALITTPEMKMSAAITFPRRKARELFQCQNGKRVVEIATQPARARRDADATFTRAWDDVGQRYFSTTHPLMRQVPYLRTYRGVTGGPNKQAFRNRLTP